eukprot:CAMPEP_0172662222 /NCGR_PEP_ID=MMETSP1074-20121228/5228_1 /TAXON_ID=2916 /ORGANISM="Ceratium fusus, Strain PA161109" /LENGTH=160 /DNA_ID=CAMNT_0013478111 /DNA_START=90 /DNA_END=573 /DNA_ORIENTATION=+
MPKGILKRWNAEKGFGFLEPSDGGEDVFCHVSAMVDGEGSVREGDLCSYKMTYDERKGKERAADVAFVEGEDEAGKAGTTVAMTVITVVTADVAAAVTTAAVVTAVATEAVVVVKAAMTATATATAKMGAGARAGATATMMITMIGEVAETSTELRAPLS